MTQYLGIDIDYSRDALFDELGMTRLKESYMMPHETSPQERYAYVSKTFSSNMAHAQRLYEYASSHWLSYSTPQLSFGRDKKGLPISCYLSMLMDTSKGLVDTLDETNWLSMLGGGVGVHIKIRQAGEKSVGVMPHMKVYDASTLAFKQGSRRGSQAHYLDIDHPDIVQFIEMRKATGDQNMRAMNLNHGINITDKFMNIIERAMVEKGFDDSWPLISPNDGKVIEVVSAKELWMKILITRMQTGEPYLWFIDRANEGLPWFQKELGLKNHGSNLCSEISLATSEDRTAVCCLSSLNLEYYDEWKDHPTFIHDVLEMLDNCISLFIERAPDVISKARYSAMRERSVGVGTLGFHAYLQKNMIAFEGVIAKVTNKKIFKHIRTQLDIANEKLALERGACPDAAEFGVMKRCAHVMAVAPNASSSIIMGNTSPSIEPFAYNAYRQDTTSGANLNKNRILEKLLKAEAAMKKDPEDWLDEQWSSIIAHGGSVQHLVWMDEYTKEVYKTFVEIDQRWVIEHSADRQEWVDQAISTNVKFPPTVNIKYLHFVHFQAWKLGLKSLYYCRSDKLKKAGTVGISKERQKIEEEIDLKSFVEEGSSCLACE